jgi:hypothetical protein
LVAGHAPDYYVIGEQHKELGLALGVADQQCYLQVDRLEELSGIRGFT